MICPEESRFPPHVVSLSANSIVKSDMPSSEGSVTVNPLQLKKEQEAPPGAPPGIGDTAGLP
jgi:hypothetical protein